jgi:branched-chain amino acid transport system substrate-binding protein
MIKKTTAVLCLLGAALSSQQAQAQASKGVIEIGCITPLSGSAAPIGDHLSAGAKFAVSQRPVINGWEIKLNLQDTAGDPANALQKAQALSGNKAVRAITCVGYSQEAAAVSGALKTGRLATISPVSSVTTGPSGRPRTLPR